MKTELDHLPSRKQREIAFIRKVLLEEFDLCLSRKSGQRANWCILKIILFGSHAKGTWVEDHASGYVSDYDILVIVNDRELLESYEVWSAADDRIMREIRAPLGLILHTWNEVCDSLAQGAYFFKDLREQGIELYSFDKRELPEPGNLSAEEQLKVASDYFSIWMDCAEVFLIR